MMTFNVRKAVFGASLVGASLLSALEAAALTEITVSDGIALTSTDEGAGDTLPGLAGVVGFSGASSSGTFNVNVVTGLTPPFLGGPNEPILDLNSINVSSSSVGTLIVMLTTTDLTGPISDADAQLFAGGTTNGVIKIESFIDPTNTAYGTAIKTGELGTFGPVAFSGEDFTFDHTPGSLYSATIIATIIHNDPGDVTSFDAEYRIVPEPGSAALLGLAAVGLISRRRRR